MNGPLHQFFWDEFSVLSQAHSPATGISSALRRPQHRQPHPLSSRVVNSVIHAYREHMDLQERHNWLESVRLGHQSFVGIKSSEDG